MFNKGDILLPINRISRKEWLNGLNHPAVVWDDFFDGTNDFQGIMITHREPNDKFDNILMSENHFETGHEVKYSNSHFVNQIFTKFQDWGEFELVGRLTPEGTEFIENKLTGDKDQMSFREYRRLIFPTLRKQ